MTAIAKPKTFTEIYNDFNDSKKALIRSSFIQYHGYSFSTFYKKITGESEFRPNEKIWIAEYLEKYFDMPAASIEF